MVGANGGHEWPTVMPPTMPYSKPWKFALLTNKQTSQSLNVFACLEICIGCLDDDRSVASCQQTCCKLIVKACYPVIHMFAASGFNKL